MTKALKFLIPSLLVAGLAFLPKDAQATRDTQASRDTQAFKENKFKETKKSPEAAYDSAFWTGERKNVPELSSSAAGASLALVAGGLLAISGRRRRKADPK